PNLLRCLRRNGCQLFLLNAFIKKNDLDIFRRFPGIFDFIHKPYHGLLAQNPDTAELFKSITRLEVKAFGNLKYASVPSAQKIKFPAAKKIIICAGSTHDREEKIIIDAASSLLKKHACLLIIAPRHSRCRELSSLLSTLPYRWKLFSEKRTEAADIILCDQNGLLCSLYKACDISIVGGSFIDTRGGHNILEPGYFGKPVIYGNFMVNYSELTGELEKKKMAFRCSAAELGRTIEKLASSKTLREKCGQGLRKKIITEQKKLSNLKKVIGAD
ncbi:MAG TPA: hypothetical protein DC049_17855, partial [Spirochaetia bacterium]|nr:hypothetical protein [Spirochaetia bacterium]